jgi:hypothetical protein
VREIVAFELAASQDCVDQSEARQRAIPHGDRDGAVQFYHR